eukprot:277475_1
MSDSMRNVSPFSITDALITNGSKQNDKATPHNNKWRNTILKICISVIILALITFAIYHIALESKASNVTISGNPSNANYSFSETYVKYINHELEDGSNGRSSSCYPRYICNWDYMDKTNGNANYWECGRNCWRGQFWTDSGCNCACIPNTPCDDSDDNDDDDSCDPHSGNDDDHRNADSSSWALTNQCLAAPDELEWSTNDGNIYSGEMVLDEKYITFEKHPNGERPCSKISDSVPSPTMVMQPGNVYKLTLKNNLGPNHPNDKNEWNKFRLANTTNLHIHGLHISGEPPGDNLVRIKIDPGESFTYNWSIPFFFFFENGRVKRVGYKFN